MVSDFDFRMMCFFSILSFATTEQAFNLRICRTRLALCLVMLFICTVSGQTLAAKPNIIFIHADDLGWNDVSFHGYNEIPTPNIDRLANEGVILNGYYTQYMCTPSRSALMTGKYPIRTGLQQGVLTTAEPRGLNLTEKILPQYLKEAGYKTHLIGKWHLGYYQRRMTPSKWRTGKRASQYFRSDKNFVFLGSNVLIAMRGFDSFFGYYNGFTDYFNYNITKGIPKEYIAFDLWDDFKPARSYVGQYATEVFTEKALDRINAHDYQNPLFLYISHLAPHFANANDPIQVPQKYIDRFPEILNENRKKYAATVSALDDSVREVFNALKMKGVIENSIIVFSSDNGGDSLGQWLNRTTVFANNWPLRGAKGSQWEGGVRAAACLWSDLLETKARVSKELYHISDWLPTLVRLAGGSISSAIDGLDIWDSISKGLPSPRTELLHHVNPNSNEYALRWHQYKLISESKHFDKWLTPEGGVQSEYLINTPGALVCNDTGPVELGSCDVTPCLFDINKDPCEYENIAESRKEILEFLVEKIKDFNQTALPSIHLSEDPRGAAALNDGLTQPWEF